MIKINILWSLSYEEITRRVIRRLTKSKLTKNIGAVLIAILLMLPVGVAVPANNSIIENSASYKAPKLESFTADIVSVADTTVKIEVVKQFDPIIIVRSGNYLPEPDLAGKRALVQTAAAAYSIDWRILEAVWQIESGKRWRTAISSYAGATGPCQFMPGTWRSYAVDGNGDGIKDITYAPDCLFGSAKLLAANGAAIGDNVRALLAYNHSMSYVNRVLLIASSI